MPHVCINIMYIYIYTKIHTTRPAVLTRTRPWQSGPMSAATYFIGVIDFLGGGVGYLD